VFERITRCDLCRRAVEGIKAALHAGLDPVKLNVVVMRGINDGEIPEFIEFARMHTVEVRFIEYMPHEQDADNGADLFVGADEILDRVRACTDVVPADRPPRSGPAEMYMTRRAGTRIGVIPSVSQPACSECNRLRLRADGQLVACLYEGGVVDLKTLIRTDASAEAIRAAFERAANLKPLVHSPTRTTYMNRLGG